MKWFWYSLIGFCLFMCGCKSKEVTADYSSRLQVKSDVSYLNKVSQIDTTKTVYSEQLSEHKVIKETIVVEEYDKDTGNLAKKTTTEREIAQDSDKTIAEETKQGIETHLRDSLNHSADASKKMDSEVKEESVGGQESFGKWLGIVMGIGIILGIIYLCKKLRIN